MHEDVKAYDLAMADESETIPHKMVFRLIEGENPITVWREHRDHTGAQLARKSGVSASMISQIESDKNINSAMTRAFMSLGPFQQQR